MAPRLSIITGCVLGLGLGLGCANPSPAPAAPSEAPAPERESAPVVAKPEQEGPAVDTSRNSGEALVALADHVTHLELWDADAMLVRLDDDVRAELVESLREDTGDNGLSATSPPWPGNFVYVYVEDRKQPFVATIVAGGSLRLNARDPYSPIIADQSGAPDFENISDVGYSELLFDAAAEQLGSPSSKEYEAAPPPP